MTEDVRCPSCGGGKFVQKAQLLLVNPLVYLNDHQAADMEKFGVKPGIAAKEQAWYCDDCGSKLAVMVHEGRASLVKMSEDGKIEA